MSPVQVRGGLGDPGSKVTSTFTVTNTGNASLSTVELTDDTCTPVYLTGDTGGDGILDPAERWTYTCDRVFTASPGPNPVTVTNNARVGATDPTGARRVRYCVRDRHGVLTGDLPDEVGQCDAGEPRLRDPGDLLVSRDEHRQHAAEPTSRSSTHWARVTARR